MPIYARQLVQLVGLKRSGLHALAFWLLGHQRRHAFVNNSPAKRPGPESAMLRTIQESPLPVRLAPGDEVAVYRWWRERRARLPDKLDLLVVVFQSQRPSHLARHQPIVQGVRADRVDTLLLLRDPFNWGASYMQRSRESEDVQVWPGQWIEYASEFVGRTSFLPGSVAVSYNRWFQEQAYRRELAARLGLRFTDATLGVVTNHAGGSSFDKMKYKGRAQEMQVLERWQSYRGNPRFQEAFRRHPEMATFARMAFDLNAPLAEFLAGLGIEAGPENMPTP